MCEYHLGTGDMFRTAGGLGIIVDKKNGKFHYQVVTPVAGTTKESGTSQIPMTSFYNSLDDGTVTDVYLVPNKKYRRKRNRT
jgi:hypothetical protein